MTRIEKRFSRDQEGVLTRWWVVSLVALVCLVGCGVSGEQAGAPTSQAALPDSQPATQTVSTPTPGLVNNAIVTATRLPTLSPVLTNTNAPVPSPSPTHAIPTETLQAETQAVICPQIEPLNYEKEQLTGVLIFSKNFLEVEPQPIFRLDLADGQIQEFRALNPLAYLVSFGVSPDQRWYAYADVTSHVSYDEIQIDRVEIFILNSRGEQINKIYYPNEVISGYWLDATHLMIRETYHADDLPDSAKFRVQHVFTGEHSYFDSASLPGFNILTEFYLGRWEVNVIYDPTLRWAVYQPLTTGEDYLALWDIEQKRTIREVMEYNEFPAIRPIWSPDGTQLVFISTNKHWLEDPQDEIYGLTATGELTRLTNLTQTYSYSSIGNMSWSPDGTRLAFWIMTEQPDKHTKYPSVLAILDLATGQVQINCLRGFVLDEPIWSPDGSWIAVTAYDEDENPNGIVLIDRNASRVLLYKFEMEGNLEGWMLNQDQ